MDPNYILIKSNIMNHPFFTSSLDSYSIGALTFF